MTNTGTTELLALAVRPDGKCRECYTPEQIAKAWGPGVSVWMAQEMADYVTLPPEGRQLMRELKGLR